MRRIPLSVFFTHLDALVTVGTIIDDGERLLETCTPNPNDISYQLANSYHHLMEQRLVKFSLTLMTFRKVQKNIQTHCNNQKRLNLFKFYDNHNH